MKLFFSTHNLDKKKEIEYIIKGKFSVLCIEDFNDYPEVEENGASLAENSLIKARAGYEHTGIRSFADDTALEVDCLDGKPGIYTARYAGENASYRDNYIKLLNDMEGSDCENRSARFRTVITLYAGKDDYRYFEGVCEGRIGLEPSGRMGFGYDPVFIPSGYQETFAHLDSAVKNRISHRARALKTFIEYLNSIAGA